MIRIRSNLFAVGAAGLSVALLVLAGCGGNSPVRQSTTTPTTPTSASAAFLQLLPASQKSATAVGVQKCGSCHNSHLTNWMHTLHSQNNVGCESCHGPGSVHAAAPAATNILTFPSVVSADVCGQCHGPIRTDFAGSPHQSPVPDPVQSGSSTCLRCHSAEFRAQYIDEPWSAGQTQAAINTAILAVPSTTLTSFGTSTTETASCTTCHDPHRATNNVTGDSGQVQLRRASSNLDPTDIGPGATLATYTNTNQACGTCHNGWGANPTDANLQARTSRPLFHEGPQYSLLLGVSGYEEAGGPPQRTSSHAEAPDQCIHCHMPSASHTFTVKVDVSCAPCHSSADASSLLSSVQSEIQNGMVALRGRMQAWSTATFGNPDLWDYTSNIPSTDPAVNEKLVPLQIERARHNYYFLLNDGSYGIHNVFYARYLLQVSNNELDAIGVSKAVPALTRQQTKAYLQEDWMRSKLGARGARSL